MLGHASQTSWLMQTAHDESQNLPDPDIFAFDIKEEVLNLKIAATTSLDFVEKPTTEQGVLKIAADDHNSGGGTTSSTATGTCWLGGCMPPQGWGHYQGH